jgi:Protein NO VEIN, C-terminal
MARIVIAVSAWIIAQKRAIPAPWHDLATVASRVVEDLDRAGALDFRYLHESLLIGWLAALGHWPDSMPRTIDAGALGLRAQTLTQAAAEANQERLERARQRRIIVVDGAEVAVEGGDYQYLYEAMKSTVGDSDPFPDRSTRFTSLAELADQPPTPRGNGTRGGYGHYDAERSMSTEQRQAVGFAGEWLAYQWLCHRYSTMSPESWVSSYRRHVFAGVPGDDDLGYDFRVVMARDLFFEVKATVGEFGEFELGESQVREAQHHARGDRWRLLVISHVLESERRSLEVLPNPFSRRGRGRFRLVGRAYATGTRRLRDDRQAH